MGLGKTMQVLALCQILRALKKKQTGDPQIVLKVLLLTNKSIVPHWENQCEKWGSPLPISQGKTERKFEKFKNGGFLVLTWEAFSLNYAQFASFFNKLDLVILDEGHKATNREKYGYQYLCKLKPSIGKIFLTGTPLQNSVKELFSILKFLFGETETNETYFDEAFAKPISKGSDSEKLKASLLLGKVFEEYMLRKSITMAGINLGPLNNYIIVRPIPKHAWMSEHR